MIYITITILLAIIFYLYDIKAAQMQDWFTMLCVFGLSGGLAAFPVTFILMLISLFFSECIGLDRAPFWVFFPFTED